MKKLILLILSFTCITFLQAKEYNVRDFGAIGDGQHLDSPAIQKAIDQCTKDGGGKVIIPGGTYLSATIIIKDNVTLHLEEGTLLLGVIDLNQYDMVDPFTEGLGIKVGRTFIAAVDARNIAIEGNGIIDGQGSALKAKHIETDTRPEGERWGERPFLLRIIRCQGVRVEDITLKYSASWTSHYAQSKDLKINNVKILSKGVAHNDGIDIDGCERVTITNCDVESGDDALCFKTTHSKYPCRNIVVDNIRLKSNQAGIKMGTESMAAFENIKITNCYIYDTNNGGIKLFSVDGAHLQNVMISDITMDNIRTPILLRLGSRLNVFRENEDVKQATGVLKNVILRNIKARSAEKTQLTSASGILMTGVPGHDIQDLLMENIEIELPGGGTVNEGNHIVPEAVGEYPEVKTFGPVIPAYGIWVRHVNGVKMKNISIKVDQPDLRPLLVLEDAKNVEFSNLNGESFVGSESAMYLKDSKDIQISVSQLKGTTKNFVKLEGKSCSDILLKGNSVLKYSGKINITKGASKKAVKFD